MCEEWKVSKSLKLNLTDSCSEGCGFESQDHILDWHFSTLFSCRNCSVCLNRRKQTKKRTGMAQLKKIIKISFSVLTTRPARPTCRRRWRWGPWTRGRSRTRGGMQKFCKSRCRRAKTEANARSPESQKRFKIICSTAKFNYFKRPIYVMIVF